MQTVTSKDGTTIAYDKVGQGPAIILVDGALCHRAFGPSGGVAAQLAPYFTVYTYDRRGRGQSTDTKPFALQREFEDIDALITAAGGSASLVGFSSGAALAMEAAIALGSSKVTKLAMYEAPYNSDPAWRQGFSNYRKEIDGLLAEGRRGDAVIAFMMLVGMPAEHVAGMKQSPAWPMFEAVGQTLAYDAAAMGADGDVPTDHAARVTMPALVMDGGASFPFMHPTAVALAKAMPHAQQRTLEGQTHEVSAEAIAPVLVEFFNAPVPVK